MERPDFFELKNGIRAKLPFTDQEYRNRLDKIRKAMSKKKIDNIFISAPENVSWLLNLRGYDNPNSPVPNSRLIIGQNKKIYLIAEKNKVSKIISNGKINKKQIVNPKKFSNLIHSLKGNKFIIDSISCSVLNENIIRSKFKIINKIKIIIFLYNFKLQNC